MSGQAKVEAIMADVTKLSGFKVRLGATVKEVARQFEARPKIESSWLDQLNDLESKARAARPTPG